MRHVRLALLFLSLFATSTGFAQPPSKTNIPKAPNDVIFEKDIVYRQGRERWVLNVIRPREESVDARPAIVLVHGGGWTGGDHYRFSRLGFTLAQQG
jgi:carboxylesterase type B